MDPRPVTNRACSSESGADESKSRRPPSDRGCLYPCGPLPAAQMKAGGDGTRSNHSKGTPCRVNPIAEAVREAVRDRTSAIVRTLHPRQFRNRQSPEWTGSRGGPTRFMRREAESTARRSMTGFRPNAKSMRNPIVREVPITRGLRIGALATIGTPTRLASRADSDSRCSFDRTRSANRVSRSGCSAPRARAQRALTAPVIRRATERGNLPHGLTDCSQRPRKYEDLEGTNTGYISAHPAFVIFVSS